MSRSLPSRPSLEFERKQARKLLNQLRKGTADALERARAQLADLTPTAERAKLADAQLVIAREYGFRSAAHGRVFSHARAAAVSGFVPRIVSWRF